MWEDGQLGMRGQNCLLVTHSLHLRAKSSRPSQKYDEDVGITLGLNRGIQVIKKDECGGRLQRSDWG